MQVYPIKKKVGKWIPFCCAVAVTSVTVMDVEFGFNDISLYKKKRL